MNVNILMGEESAQSFISKRMRPDIVLGEKKMTDKDAQIAQLQELCCRTLAILEDEGFFGQTCDGEFWHASLHRDLTKAAMGREFKLFKELMKHLPNKESEND